MSIEISFNDSHSALSINSNQTTRESTTDGRASAPEFKIILLPLVSRAFECFYKFLETEFKKTFTWTNLQLFLQSDTNFICVLLSQNWCLCLRLFGGFTEVKKKSLNVLQSHQDRWRDKPSEKLEAKSLMWWQIVSLILIPCQKRELVTQPS